MALLRCDVDSAVLQMGTTITVILPQDQATPFSDDPVEAGPPPPVLYLLHGNGDDATGWTRMTAVERYVAPLGIAVVMPEVGRSCYTDQVHGQRYGTYLTQELPYLVQQMFHVSTRPEETFVAGLSMGGYGAMRWALREPERFAAVASMSGVLDMARVRAEGASYREPSLHAAFGDGDLSGTEADLLHLLAEASRSEQPLPAIYVSCGTRDSLHDDNVRFVAAAAALGIDIHSNFGPGGHEWPYWDKEIRNVLDWLPLNPRA
jgi:S-formylglutathione hydrolase FrmB